MAYARKISDQINYLEWSIFTSVTIHGRDDAKIENYDANERLNSA